MSGRFDPDPAEPYGKCSTCGEVISDRKAMNAHFEATMHNSRSHSVRITNPTRLERIERELDSLVEDALNDFVNEAERLMDDDVTEQEITEAVQKVFGDFAEAWKSRDD